MGGLEQPPPCRLQPPNIFQAALKSVRRPSTTTLSFDDVGSSYEGQKQLVAAPGATVDYYKRPFGK
jgi:hypothetical protein